jgi:hypothetical protein
MNLGDISCLRVFALDAIIDCDVQEFVVLCDISHVLSTIPASNKVTTLFFHFSIVGGDHPFDECLKEDWAGIWGEVVRISAGKPLELNLEAAVDPLDLKYSSEGKDELYELYERIKEKIALLSNFPNIDTYFWHPF